MIETATSCHKNCPATLLNSQEYVPEYDRSTFSAVRFEIHFGGVDWEALVVGVRYGGIVLVDNVCVCVRVYAYVRGYCACQRVCVSVCNDMTYLYTQDYFHPAKQSHSYTTDRQGLEILRSLAY